MIRIIFTRQSDNGVVVITPLPKIEIEKMLGPITDTEYLDHVYERSIPEDAINPITTTLESIPKDKQFRDAWKQNGNIIDFDLIKAKDIQLERIRTARKPLLEALDIEFIEAIEMKLDTTAIIAEKERLRNITEPLKQMTPTSIDDIKNAFPVL